MKEISIAIRGLGKFAAPIRSYMGSQELRKTLHKLLQFSERHYAASSGAEQVEDLIHHLSSFLQAFAAMLFHVSDVDDSFLDHLDDLFVAIFWLYPQLFEGQRHVQHNAIAQLFLALHSKGSALASLSSRVIFKGLAYTCSQPRSSFAPTGVGRREKKHFEYYQLWKRVQYPVLNSCSFTHLVAADLCIAKSRSRVSSFGIEQAELCPL